MEVSARNKRDENKQNEIIIWHDHVKRRDADNVDAGTCWRYSCEEAK